MSCQVSKFARAVCESRFVYLNVTTRLSLFIAVLLKEQFFYSTLLNTSRIFHFHFGDNFSRVDASSPISLHFSKTRERLF